MFTLAEDADDGAANAPADVSTADPTQADPARVAAEIRARRGDGGVDRGDAAPRPGMVRDRKTGRWRAAKAPGRKPKAGTAPARKSRSDGDDSREPDTDDAGPVEVTPADIAACTMVGAAVWKIAGPSFRLRPLTEAEAVELGSAAAPVVAKYLPALNDYAAEIALAMVLAGLVQTTRIPIRAAETVEGPPDATTPENAIDPNAHGAMPVVR